MKIHTKFCKPYEHRYPKNLYIAEKGHNLIIYEDINMLLKDTISHHLKSFIKFSPGGP